MESTLLSYKEGSTGLRLWFSCNHFRAELISLSLKAILPYRIEVDVPAKIVASGIVVTTAQVAATAINVDDWSFAVCDKIVQLDLAVLADHIRSPIDLVMIYQ